MKNSYEIPKMDIIEVIAEEVITASTGLNGKETGDGESGSFNELFPDF